jgi:hypothetical protein
LNLEKPQLGQGEMALISLDGLGIHLCSLKVFLFIDIVTVNELGNKYLKLLKPYYEY